MGTSNLLKHPADIIHNINIMCIYCKYGYTHNYKQVILVQLWFTPPFELDVGAQALYILDWNDVSWDFEVLD